MKVNGVRQRSIVSRDNAITSLQKSSHLNTEIVVVRTARCGLCKNAYHPQPVDTLLDSVWAVSHLLQLHVELLAEILEALKCGRDHIEVKHYTYRTYRTKEDDQKSLLTDFMTVEKNKQHTYRLR